MPWKEPGKKPREPRGREPWGHGGGGGGGGGGPDLEAWLRNWRRQLGPFGHGPLGIGALIVLLIILWFVIGGWVVVGNQQAGVLLRFGSLQAVLQPGLHFHLPTPIDRVRIVDMGRTRTLSDNVRLLTADQQLAEIDYQVQYKVADPRKFLYSTRNAQQAARNAATVAVRAVAGTRTLAQLMGHTDGKLGDAVDTRLTAALARLDIGITVTNVSLPQVGVPSEVKSAFDGIAKAHEANKAAQAAAEAAAASAKAAAQAKAAALLAAAQGYRSKTVSAAQAQVARFDALLAQYQVAPQVTGHRLWLNAMHDVLSKNHVVINTGTSNVIVQFPVRRTAPTHTGASPAPATSAAPAPSASSGALPVTTGPPVNGSDG